MRSFYGFSTNRTLCDVLEEMRKAYETRNFSYLPGLIEEAQTMGNRMERGLWDQKEFKSAWETRDELKQEIASLKKEKEKIEE